eukprot:CAMPEP_0171087102 /NCGR_PEP_ID=MMETSP0766_2-20121228/19950_1 /TAXON_ID=439317 /ORGANISM="Gambierdiscus australes, Strain CAWD 149" /LENGTH=269 /DNA_ID=CAMNT_0011544789 /DNA_START=250 /DNA_END=1059 /DNA_ORIENTATION=-
MRFYLFTLTFEVIILGALLYSFDVASQLRLTLFICTLLLECMLVLSALRESERHKCVREVRRFQWDIRTKLYLMACGAWLPPAWWFFELVMELRGRRKSVHHWSARHPVNLERALFAFAMLALHTAIAVFVVRVAWHGSTGLLQQLLKHAVLKARTWSEVPKSARTHETRCAICLSEFEKTETVFLLPCRHVFHVHCLCRWLERSDSCPLRCQASVLQLPPRGMEHQGSRRLESSEVQNEEASPTSRRETEMAGFPDESLAITLGMISL